MDLMLEKKARIAIPPRTLNGQLGHIVRAARDGNLMVKRGALQDEEIQDEQGNRWHYEAILQLTGLEAVPGYLRREIKRHGEWEYRILDAAQAVPIAPVLESALNVTLPELTEEVYASYFKGIYRRESHIRLLHATAQAAVRWKGKHSTHTLLYGSPGTGKTKLIEAVQKWYLDTTKRELIVAPSTTKAGLEAWLLDANDQGRLPPVLLIEQVDRLPKADLATLVSVMDGHLSKRTAVETLVSVWMTCRNAEILKRHQSGSDILSKAVSIRCRRPGRKTMGRILLDECVERGIDPSCADIALDFASDLGIRDPRGPFPKSGAAALPSLYFTKESKTTVACRKTLPCKCVAVERPVPR